jgi:RNA polymerase sigma factor (sigma-70 family)
VAAGLQEVKHLTDAQLIEKTINATIHKINNITMIDRVKILKEDTFKNTEKLLYNYYTLKEHVTDEDGYYGMMDKRGSGSIIRYSKSKAITNDDEMQRCREESYLRSKNDLSRLDKALSKVRNKKEFKVIDLRYLQKNEYGETYTFEEIAEILEKDEKTVRVWKNKIIKEISIYLFGSDAI